MTNPDNFTLSCRYYQGFPFEAPVGYVTNELELRKSRTAFLIIDVYGLGFDEDSPASQVSDLYVVTRDYYKDVVVNHIKPAKVAAKKIGLPIIYLCNYLAPSTTIHNQWRQMSLRGLNVDVLDEWREPTDIFKYSKVIAPEPGEYEIKKQHYSGFFETHLESLLKELDVKDLVVVGFDGLMCLHTTVIDALFRNYRVVVLRDCVGTLEFADTLQDRTCHWLAIRYIESNVGYTSTSSEFIQAVDRKLVLLP
jgi:ureidoacrylate peracid hydrolase